MMIGKPSTGEVGFAANWEKKVALLQLPLACGRWSCIDFLKGHKVDVEAWGWLDLLPSLDVIYTSAPPPQQTPTLWQYTRTFQYSQHTPPCTVPTLQHYQYVCSVIYRRKVSLWIQTNNLKLHDKVVQQGLMSDCWVGQKEQSLWGQTFITNEILICNHKLTRSKTEATWRTVTMQACHLATAPGEQPKLWPSSRPPSHIQALLFWRRHVGNGPSTPAAYPKSKVFGRSHLFHHLPKLERF